MKKVFLLTSVLLLLCSQAFAEPIRYKAILNGPNESPANSSPGIGFAIVTIDTAAHLLSVYAEFSGLTGVTTASHIHCCTTLADAGTAAVATQTPSFIGFPLGVTSGTFLNSYDTLAAGTYRAGFITSSGGTEAQAEAVLAAGLADGKAYFNIHTTAFPGGEIRGFLHDVPEPTTLLLLGAGLAGIAVIRRRYSM